MERHGPFDLLVVGGGINGAGIARDASGRGLKVILVEKNDLASATSSASSKLVHGGLRYLEQFDLRLVREALAEREVLLSIAPHICRPLTFVLPHEPAMRPAWMIGLGLFLYDHLASRSRLPASQAIDFGRHPAGGPLAPSYKRGFIYADCLVDDSRLVVLNAVDARERGAEIRTRCALIDAEPDGGVWRARVAGDRSMLETITAKIIINAAGPWVENVRRAITSRRPPGRVRLIKGSHIVVPRLYAGDHAYLLQTADRRIVFLIPFEEAFTLIGTTEITVIEAAERTEILPEEQSYLCDATSRYLKRSVRVSDIVWSYSGVRPLYDDASANPSAVSRDYVLDLEAEHGPPVLSIIGGKITTYRRLAEHALAKVAEFLPGVGPAWTAGSPLPGGDFHDLGDLIEKFSAARPWLPKPLARRLCRTYGTRAERIVPKSADNADGTLDQESVLTQSELRYLVDVEFAQTAEDVLWRRTKLGLHGGVHLKRMTEDWLRQARS
jgi:glycerol-3-phosphate dehydrogenase